MHQLHSGARQTDGAIAQLVCLPGGAGRNTRAAEQALCNGTIGLIGQAGVEGAQRDREPVTSVPRQPFRRTDARPASGDAPEAERRIGTRAKVSVERDDNGGRRCCAGAANEHHRQTTVTLVDEPVAPVACAALKCRRHPFEAARIPETIRRRRNNHGAGIEMRQPDDGRPIRSQIRIDRETAAPTSGAAPRETRPRQRRRPLPPDSRAGIRDCGAGIPRRTRQD